MRKCAEDEGGVRERGVFGRYIRHVATTDPRGRAALFVRGGERERQSRMAQDERAKLAANVSAGPENPHGYLIHDECIIIHRPLVNSTPDDYTIGMPRKTERQAEILQLIDAHDVASQEHLKKLLRERGKLVTQATLSRDLRELGVVRVPGVDGARYAMPEAVTSDTIPALESLLPQLFSSIDGVGELIVLHTLASGAQPVSEAIDAEGWREVLGTVAGENTILIICRSAQARQEVSERLSRIATGKPGLMKG